MPSTPVAEVRWGNQYILRHVCEAWKALTFLLEENTTLRYDNGHIAVDVAFPVIVHQRDGNIGVGNALSQRNAEDALWSCFC